MQKLVHALVGSDLFLQLEALRQIIAEAPAGAQRIDVDGETAELADVLDELRSFSMFSSCKVLVVREADAFITRYRQSLESYAQKPVPDSVLVLRVSSLPASQKIYKAIQTSGRIHDCNPPKDVVKWVVERATGAHKLKLRPDAARVLVDLIGKDMGRLDNELAKLALQSDGPVGAEAIESTVAFQREQEMWDLTNEIAAGQVAGALRRWRRMVQLDKSAEYRAVVWLTIWLEKVRKALILRREGKAPGAIASELKIWPASQQAAFFKTAATVGDEGVRRLLSLLAQTDQRSKSGLGEMAENVERFLLSVGLLLGHQAPGRN